MPCILMIVVRSLTIEKVYIVSALLCYTHIHTYLRETMEKQHERFRALSSSDKVELDPIGCHVLVGAQGWIQQAGGRDCMKGMQRQLYCSNTIRLLYLRVVFASEL